MSGDAGMFEKWLIRIEKEKKKRHLEAQYRKDMLPAFYEVLARYGVRRAYIFGSVVHGMCSPGSDIDLYVEEVPGEQFWSLRRDLEEVSGFSVDLHNQSDDANFVSKIKKRGEIFYEV